MNVVYNRTKDLLGSYETFDIGFLLVKAGYTPDPDHEFVADITDEEDTGGYSRQTGTLTVDRDTIPGTSIIGSDTSATFTSAASVGLVVFLQSGDDATARVLVYLDLGGTLDPAATINFPDGLVTVT